MKLPARITLALLLSFVFFSCHRLHDAVSTKADPNVDYEKEGYVKAYVTDVELDGCKWMLALENDNKRLEPDGLQPEFEKDSLKVWLKYAPEDRMSVCMAGQTIKVIDIRKR